SRYYVLASLSRTSSRFFLSLYGAHRDLHSFPTRRSSDLVGFTLRIDGGLRFVGFGSFRLLFEFVRILKGELRSIGILVERDVALDRKSTRLNSSHVKISYAVFCLKKKRIKKRTKHTHHML